MPRAYEHLSRFEREIIAHMLGKSYSWVDIGEQLNRSVSTVWREYHRNRESDGHYRVRVAHERSLARRRRARRPRLIVGEVRREVTRGLKRYWSPDQIHGRGDREGEAMTSVMTMYRFLDRPEGQEYRKYLRHSDRARRRRKAIHERIHERVMIDERPREVEERREVGHWEADTVRGPMKTSSCVMSVVERVSQYLVARLLPERNAEHLNRAMAASMKGFPLKTVTVDNGMEFASHKELKKKTGASVYFAHEKCPWQRGLNEHENGLLRQFFPKGTNFETVSPAQLRRAICLINNRPRKSLGYRTPKEVMQQLFLCS